MIGVPNPPNLSAKTEPQAPCLAMRPREAAKALGISERLLWDWTSRGQVPHVRVGKAILYPTAVLEDWLKDQAGRPKDAVGEMASLNRAVQDAKEVKKP